MFRRSPVADPSPAASPARSAIGEDRVRFLSEMIRGNPKVTADRFVRDHKQARPPALDDDGLTKLSFGVSLSFDGPALAG